MTTLESRPPEPAGREDRVDNDQKPCGHGRMLRKEDPRFIRGRGNYVDDISLPGMLHLAILRSPYAHARINSIDVSAAQAHPKVKAVVTGADLAGARAIALVQLAAQDDARADAPAHAHDDQVLRPRDSAVVALGDGRGLRVIGHHHGHAERVTRPSRRAL